MRQRYVDNRPVEVDPEDEDLTQRAWSLAGGKGETARRYLARQVTVDGSRKIQYLHRVIAERMGLIESSTGSLGGRWTVSVDHADGNKYNNRRANLRLRTRVEQMTNLNDAPQSNSTSGARGVSYTASRRAAKKWYAHVMVDGKSKSLGYYATRDEAVAARTAWDEGRWVKPVAQARPDNTSGHRGVSFAAKRGGSGRWVAYGTVNGRRHSLGDYRIKDEAVAARRRWEETL